MTAVWHEARPLPGDICERAHYILRAAKSRGATISSAPVAGGGALPDLDRLEAILKAEGAARHVVADAREEAGRIAAAAAAEAELVRVEAARDARERGEVLRGEAVEAARAAAETILSEESFLRPPREVIEATVRAALESVQ